MSRRGENIRKRKDGRWEARYEKGRTEKGTIIYGFLYGKSYREAKEKKLQALQKQMPMQISKNYSAFQIQELSSLWLEYVHFNLKESTYGAMGAVVGTLIAEMAKANGVNVYHYLTYLLEKLPDDRMSDDELELLAP